MKRGLLYLIGSLILFGCQKNEVELLFDGKPEERAGTQLSKLRTLLVSSENGWNASLNTGGKGGYGFYFDFKDGATVEMLSDLNTETATKPVESTYRVIWAMNASLVFDTFNYITMLQEPSSAYGGTAPNGYQSDIEFEYLKSSNDSIYMEGKKYGQLMLLTKATAAQKASYLSGKMDVLKNELMSYFSTKYNNYIEVEGISNKIEVNFNVANKTFTAQYIAADQTVSTHSGKFNFNANGLNLSWPILINDILFVSGTLDNGVFKLYDNKGKEYLVKQNSSPILPIENVYGYNKTYKIIGNSTSALPSVSITSDFTSVWNTMVNNFISSGRTVRYFEFKFEGAKSIVFNLYYASGTSNFTAAVTFDYKIENGVMQLSNPTGHTSGNWNTRRAQIQPLETYLLNMGPVRIDWVPNTAGLVVGGLYSVDTPSKVLYGLLK